MFGYADFDDALNPAFALVPGTHRQALVEHVAKQDHETIMSVVSYLVYNNDNAALAVFNHFITPSTCLSSASSTTSSSVNQSTSINKSESTNVCVLCEQQYDADSSSNNNEDVCVLDHCFTDSTCAYTSGECPVCHLNECKSYRCARGCDVVLCQQSDYLEGIIRTIIILFFKQF